MNPFLVLFKPLYMVFTWIVTAIVAGFMALGGMFNGAPRDGGATAVGVMHPATNQRPALLIIKLSDGESFQGPLDPDPTHALQPSAEILEVIGPEQEGAVFTFVRLHGDRGRLMDCRLSYDTIKRIPGGTCAVGTELVYDLRLVDKDEVDRTPQLGY